MADFPKLKDSDMADLEKYTADLANALAGELETVNNEIGEVNQSMQDLQNDVNNNTNNILEINNFIENSMKTLSAEGTSIHVADSADYPCKLKVKGKSEQKTRSGVNQLKITATNQTARGVTYTINEDKTVTANGTVTAEGFSSIRLVENINKSFGGYMLSGCPSGGGASTYLLRATYTDGTYDNDMGDGVVLQDKPIDYVMTRIEKNYTVNNIVFKPMISETAADYEEHGVMPSPDYPSPIENVSGDLEVKATARNILPRTFAEDLLKRLNVSSLDNYLVEVNGKNYFKYPAQLGYQTGKNYFIKDVFKENTQYVFKLAIMKSNSETSVAYNIQIKYKDGTIIAYNNGSRYWTNMTEEEATIISDENKTIEGIGISYNSGITYINLDKYILCKLEAGMDTSKLEYEPYKEQTVTFPLGEQKLMKDGYLGENGVVNKRKQYIFTGNEPLLDYGSTDEYFGFAYLVGGIILDNMGFCNFFKLDRGAVYKKNGNGIWIAANNGKGIFRFSIDKKIASTFDEVKAWLAEQYANGTPVIVEYVLAEEETTAYTSEQQTAYNNLQKLKTYRTTTNISNSQDTNMKLSYKKDLQTQFQELETMLLESGV